MFETKETTSRVCSSSENKTLDLKQCFERQLDTHQQTNKPLFLQTRFV